MYKVIKAFEDLQDNRHVYEAGHPFPRKGVNVSEERLAELAGSTNRRGEPLIKLVAHKGKSKAEQSPEAKQEAKEEAEEKK